MVNFETTSCRAQDVRELAALVASKVYYHLGSYEDSLNYALGAGHLFDVSTNEMLSYAFGVVMGLIQNRGELLRELATPD